MKGTVAEVILELVSLWYLKFDFGKQKRVKKWVPPPQYVVIIMCEEFEFPAVGQFCKNIVLAGVGSLTLVDDRAATEEMLSSNFLIPPDENVYSGKTLAELCCNSLKDFNPMVHVSVEKGFC